MPGRRFSVAPSPKKAKTSKQKPKRFQNALALAEQQAPVRSNIRQTRLGQSESKPSKRKRQDQDEDCELEDGHGDVKRLKAGVKDRYGNEIERGSDSSGNEWTVGQVDEDDDSDIDSDEAMAESDEDGLTIRGSKLSTSSDSHLSKPTAVQLEEENIGDIDLREDSKDEGDSDGDSYSFGDDGVDLAAMLDVNDDGEGLPRISREYERSGDEGFISESEEKAVDAKATAEEEESTLSYSGDEDDADDSAKLASLKALVSTMNEQDQGTNRSRAPIDAQESTKPSEFGVNSKRKLTVADLVPSVTDPSLRRSLKLLADNDSKGTGKRGGIAKKLDVPLPKRQQDQSDRAAAYDKSKETLNRWIDTVKHNRRAEHLSFPLKDPNAVAAQGSSRLIPPSHSQPLTDLESIIQNILQDSGLAAPDGKSGEDQLQAFEELKTNKMPLEEVQARRAELRRARELLFREEIRAKRIKKIKSKTYRKVHRKERERNAQKEKDALAAAGVDDSESSQNRKDRRRAEERMGARHRESKWAKGVKDSGRAKWDEDARSGVTEMAGRGEELRRRIEGKAVAENEDGVDSSESDDDNGNDSEDADGKRDQRHYDRLRKLDMDVNDLESGAKGSKLASMDFMKKAEAARKARNDADVESLRRDLAGEETPSEGEIEEGPGRQIFGPAKSRTSTSKAPQSEQQSEFEERRGFDLEDEDDQRKQGKDELEIVVNASDGNSKTEPASKPWISDKQRKKAFNISADPTLESSNNPWLMTTKKGSNIGKKRNQDSHAGAIISNTLATNTIAPSSQFPAPRSALEGSRNVEKTRQTNQRSITATAAEAANSEDSEDSSTDKLPFVLRNHDLVRKAFAGDEVVANFEAEKRATIQDEEEKTIDNTLPGWGSWTGAGLGKKQQKRNKGKVLTKQPGIAKEKRQDAKLNRVIINEKRVKKNDKYRASSLPHPFETRQQYERSLRLGMGPEFVTKLTGQEMTKPRILMKQGIIAPMAKPMI